MNHPAFGITAFLFSGLALCASVFVALDKVENGETTPPSAANTSTSPTTTISPELKKQIQELVEATIQTKMDKLKTNKIAQQNIVPQDMETFMREHGRSIAPMIMKTINDAILKEASKQLAKVDWQDKLSQQKLMSILKNAARSSGFGPHEYKEVDLSDCDTVDKKITKILNEFEGARSYSANNKLVKQMIDLGPEAIEPLLKQLKEAGRTSWAKRSATSEALEGLLTPDHKDLILKEFEENSHFSKLIKKYQFPEAEELVLAKIDNPQHGYLNNNIIDAALAMNEREAIPKLKEYIKTSQNPCYAAKQLASMQGVDITEELKAAADNAKYPWAQQQLSDIMLEKGMKEGLGLAYVVLTSTERHSEHSKREISTLVRKYTGAKGNYAEMAAWLKDNYDYVQWNDTTNRFE